MKLQNKKKNYKIWDTHNSDVIVLILQIYYITRKEVNQ